MRQLLDRPRLERVMRSLGEAAREPIRIYLNGGATAVLLGWRESTVDLDFLLEPDRDGILGRIPELKERLEVNLEPASPRDFLPELEGWRERSRFERCEGNVTFLHYDLLAQALAKIERGHAKDIDDVRAMFALGLVTPTALRGQFEQVARRIETDPRWSAIDLPSFREAFELALAARESGAEG